MDCRRSIDNSLSSKSSDIRDDFFPVNNHAPLAFTGIFLTIFNKDSRSSHNILASFYFETELIRPTGIVVVSKYNAQ
jgi:hypothetical protein